MEFICLFLPAFLALYIDIKLNKIEKYNYGLVIKYFVYCFIINMIGNTFIWIISSEKYLYYAAETFSYDFCLKYMWLTAFIAVVLPLIGKFIKVEFEVKRLENKKGTNREKKSNK